MDYVFFQAAGINGFDSFGHYLRAALIVNQCANYAVTPVGGCSANFTQAGATSALAAAASSGDPTIEATARALAGLPQKTTKHRTSKRRRSTRERPATAPKAEAAPTPTPTPTPGAAPAPTATAVPQPSEQEKTDTLLDYLFGGDE